ncbi:MAG: hypothetical protein HQL42_18080 [Alphaproteobacteria bacterium]|nr:hypothetical protein [Alphaproteobacteria bacterium]
MIRRSLLSLVLLLGGCAESVFVDREIGVSIDKGEDKVAKFGMVEICYATDTPWSEVQGLADEECGRLGWQATLYKSLKWQCRMSAPHIATFQCFVPGYAGKDGVPINPANKKAFMAWKKAQADKAAKTAPSPDVVAPQGAAPQAVAPAPMMVPSSRPLSPADIAGKPDWSAAPMNVAPAPVQGAYPTNGFTLTPKGWGEHFEE